MKFKLFKREREKKRGELLKRSNCDDNNDNYVNSDSSNKINRNIAGRTRIKLTYK